MRTETDIEAAVVAVGDVRRSLVDKRDIRNEVGFQNDINLLLSALDGTRAPWEAAAQLFAPMKPPAPRRPDPGADARTEGRTWRHRLPPEGSSPSTRQMASAGR